MSMNKIYEPINCDAYDNLELACQKKWVLDLELKNGEQLNAQASNIISRKHVEYLEIVLINKTHELRLDHIAKFTHPKLGTISITEE
ncbi:Rho-binding antiterminator [Enterobacteriaceae bacterium LUAb1]